MTPGVLAELERLVAALCDDRLDDAEHRRLEELLRGDAECRRVYLRYVDLHVRLMHHPRLSALLDEAPPRVARNVAAAKVAPARATANKSLAGKPVLRRRWWPYAATAALTLAASLVIQAYVSPPPEPEQPIVAAPVVEAAANEAAIADAGAVEAVLNVAPTYVATVTKTDESVWDQREPLRPGMRLLPGELKLLGGKAELQFDGGATLVLEGPAQFNVESRTAATIAVGKVLFSGDASSEPFQLQTPFARLVDYGTEYAVAIGPSSEEVHVFDGEVVRTPMAAAEGEALASINVVAGEARRFESRTCKGRSVPLDPERLRIRACSPKCGAKPPVEELLAYEPFWCDAPTIPAAKGGNGGLGWAGGWLASSKAELQSEFRLVGSLWRPQMATAVEGGGVSIDRRGSMSRQLSRPMRMDQDGVYYFSVLVLSQRRSTGDACDVQLVLRDGRDSAPHSKLAIGISWSSSKTSFCCQGGGNCASLPLEPGKTYLLAGKIVCGREHPDQAFLRLYSPRQLVEAEEPTDWTVVSRPIQSDLSFDTLHVNANTSSPVALDEIRLGTTWRAVTGIYVSAPEE